ncbi:MAG: site-specific DNA-methyltransferase [Bacteroides sp.]|nr:site-specific DNA-methyltransferase [Bacteroides sp.]MCM1094884.1 site-specific DNA-methyltransferase [Terasakiella sp.]
MNRKRRDVENYLDNRLPAMVKAILAQNSADKTEDLKRELSEAISSARMLGVDPDSTAKVQMLRKAISQQGSPDELENTVYSHLATFFSRYYEGGDFISQRRYKKDVYAIPYEGEEIKLHWATSDQYYIKTGEYFRTYSFSLGDDGKRVEFALKEATTEQNNNLAQNNMERRFAICEECPVTVAGNTLQINFTYGLYPKSTRQKRLVEEAYTTVKDLIPRDFMAVLAPCPTDKDRSRTLLQKHLGDYVAKNTFDYFIHKDLRSFLSRELDFYIKNEILEIDDIDARKPEDFMRHLSVIKAIKSVGSGLIEFLSQLEDFQKRLWLKKKFVVQSDWCITLDRVPRELYADICANDAQREEWVRLFAIDELKGAGKVGYSVPLTEAFLMQNQYLVLDTALFADLFKHRLLSSIPDLDAQTDGLLINSENFQAIRLIGEKYRQSIKCVYIDPPYNAPSSEILYKNNYKDSSWLSMMHNRLSLSKSLSTDDGSHIVAIDKYEDVVLCRIMEDIFPDSDVVNVAIEHNKKGAQGDHFSFNNEFAVFAVPYSLKKLNRIERDESEWEWSNLRNWGGESLRTDAANCFYPILVKDGKVIGYGNVTPDDIHPTKNTEYSEDTYFDIYGKEVCTGDARPTAVYPVDDSGIERKWRYAFQSICEIIGKLRVKTRGAILDLEMPKFNDQFKTLWYSPKYNAGDNGTKLLTAMGLSRFFSYPKSIHTTGDCIFAVSADDDIILDYFAGSGTTGHAVINLNRADGERGRRKYILVEMGTYFDTVTKPRLQKAIYSCDWSDGKPVSRRGSSHCFKYMRLEQYEDTLNNLSVAELQTDMAGDFTLGYMLGYMLDVETRDSLLNLKWFVNPFDMTFDITRNNETRARHIDMPETFNYLIGLHVSRMSWPVPGIMTVEGTTRSGEKSLVIWRDCTSIDNAALNDFFTRSAYADSDRGYDTVYVNGDNNLATLRNDCDTWRVELIEQVFNQKMFE